MRNIFILYIPTGNYEAQVHYQDTIKNRVEPSRIFRYVDFNFQSTLKSIFGNRKIAVWGSRDSAANRSMFERMQAGDDILIVEGDTIRLLGKVAAKTVNPDLSRDLWKNLRGGSSEGWDLIYFIANPMEIDLPFSEFNRLFEYKENYSLRGFTVVGDEKLKQFYSRYDDLYSILQRIKLGEQLIQKEESITYPEYEEEKPAVSEEDIREKIDDKEISEHVRMQWKLLLLGLKAGSKVWIPKGDQSKITREFDFRDFEEEFTAGIDVPSKYVDNIDVVWKEEFRIDAAFEVENTTSIYSGLLRFSDLKIVAPNSIYPLFVVAPLSKRNRLIEQIKRPTFRKLEFDRKVRYLSFEAVNEIDRFFEGSSSGLNIELLSGKSEAISS
jgi:hypothetical protein